MNTISDVADLCVRSEGSLRDAMERIDRARRGVALVVDAEDRLLDVITDGDVRRAVLDGTDLESPLGSLRERRKTSPYVAPLAARVGTPQADLVSIMRRNGIRHLPLLDERERVAGLVTLEELLPADRLPVEALIMAGGAGTRLRPLTEQVPKPMLPVGGRPLLEHIVQRLRHAGIGRVHITTHYLPEKITEHFGDGHRFGVDVRYVSEDRALGTAGALGLIAEPGDPLLVINGDILTAVDYRAMLAYHQDSKADLTVATRRHQIRVPYGVVDCQGSAVRGIREKPELRFFVNAGIYLIEPSALALVPSGEPFQMTDLIERLLAEGRPVVSFPVLEYWTDIGALPDYARAQEDVRRGRVGRSSGS